MFVLRRQTWHSSSSLCDPNEPRLNTQKRYGEKLLALCDKFGLGIIVLQKPLLSHSYMSGMSDAHIQILFQLQSNTPRFVQFMQVVSGALGRTVRGGGSALPSAEGCFEELARIANQDSSSADEDDPFSLYEEEVN
jgi:hypothetical protein